MWLKTLQWRIEYAGIRLVGAFMGALPLAAASAFSGWGWRTIGPWTRRHRRTLEHIALALPELDAPARERVARDMWESLGRTFGEFFHIEEITASRVNIVDPAKLERLRLEQRGVVFCSLHLGNWEIAAHFGALAGFSIASVYQKLTNPLVDAYVTERRRFLYPGGLMPKAPETARALLKHVRGGGALAILADLREKRGIEAPFFGRPAPSSPFPAMLARQVGAPVYVGRVVRRPGPMFDFDLEEVAVARGEDRDADILATTAAIQATLEAFVRDDPGQWMWAHRRWG